MLIIAQHTFVRNTLQIVTMAQPPEASTLISRFYEYHGSISPLSDEHKVGVAHVAKLWASAAGQARISSIVQACGGSISLTFGILNAEVCMPSKRRRDTAAAARHSASEKDRRTRRSKEVDALRQEVIALRQKAVEQASPASPATPAGALHQHAAELQAAQLQTRITHLESAQSADAQKLREAHARIQTLALHGQTLLKSYQQTRNALILLIFANKHSSTKTSCALITHEACTFSFGNFPKKWFCDECDLGQPRTELTIPPHVGCIACEYMACETCVERALSLHM